MTPDPTSPNPQDVPKNIVLVGFMGSGKSTVGRVISQQLNYPLIDTDQLIVEQTGTSIADIFSQHGEEHFRALETQLLQQLIDTDGPRQVISTGGGLPVRSQNRDLLKKLGYVVWLQASVSSIIKRTKSSNHRPLLNRPNPRQIITDMLAERDALYAECADLTVPTDDLPIADTAHGIIESARYFFSNY